VQSTYPTPVLPSTLPSLTISETGSSLLFPLFNIWVKNFTAAYPSVQINTASTGSGTGQSDAEAGTVQIGASDAYLTVAQSDANPGVLNIPLAISAQMINYNIPGLPAGTSLNLNGNVLAGIYNGTITTWNNAAIAKLNPTVSLPSNTIVPLHRSDSSGDTFIFTTYLSDQSPDWSKSVGYGTSVSWPSVPSGIGETGNGGMVTGCNSTPYCIAYIGISYMTETNADGLGIANLQNAAGNFVAITQANINAAVVASATAVPPDQTISLVNAPGANSYPIINFEYAIVKTTQPNANTALVVRTALNWAIEAGNAPYYLNQVGFVPLPPAIAGLSYAQIAQITG
jgi:phosphate transport system substrate-binding protein